MEQEYYEDADYVGDEEGEEIEIEALGVDVSSQPIELYKVFKIANLVSGGGEAKHIISEGYVAVNGELETRKRRKMYDGDFFEFNQEYYVVVCDQPVQEVVAKPEKVLAAKKPAKSKTANKTNAQSKENKKNSSHPLSAKAEPKKSANNSNKSSKASKSNQAKKAKTEDKPKAERDQKSGRHSISFF
ncbi:RNA-binding S4 domain-containing protein [Vibrio kagoshimensis]|uniref:RNA-binding S4 domain-containing protein n=1 Tax=Vibrio kagoshimensis TaxID=2910244 RepID=UPI003D2229B1